MPKMTGIDVVKAIREMYESSNVVTMEQMPYVCCCTAYSDDTFK